MHAATGYKAALVAFLVALPGAAFGDQVAGATLPDDAVKVADRRHPDRRYRVSRGYEETVKFYRQVYGPRYRRRPIADLPSVKAVHIENPDAKPGRWEGLNVYELKGETRIFVVVQEPEKQPSR
jgi:hypothetical protein